MRRSIRSVALLAALGACGCGVRPADPGGLVIAVDAGPSNLDPRLGSDEGSRRFQDLVFNSLYRTGDDARPVPDLARGLRRPDPLTLVVTIAEGVRFHDGAILTSADVAATYRSVLDGSLTSYRRADLDTIERVDTPDARTIVFHLRRPFAPLVSNLTLPILRAGAGAETARHPIGTGPFRLARYRRDEDLLLTRFDDYFAGKSPLTSLRLRVIPSETARLLELLTGGVDLVVNDLSSDGIARARRETSLRVESRPGRNAVYMAFNLGDPLLADVRVRRAIALALDREAIRAHLLRGAATLATGLLPPGHWAYNPAVPMLTRDLDEARRLLDAAGHPDPDGPGPALRLRLEYKAPASEQARQQAAAIQAQLLEAGIGIEVRTYEWATFYEDLRAGRFQIVVSNWTDLSDPDIYRLRFHSAEVPPAGLNRGGYRSAEADRLIESGAATDDEAARRAAYDSLQIVLARDLPYVVLWHRDVVAALGPRVEGFTLTSGADFRPLAAARVRDRANPVGGALPAGATPERSGEPAPEGRLDGGARHRAGAQEPGRIDREIDERRGLPAPRAAAVEDQGQLVAERGKRFVGGGGGRLGGAIGAGGDDRPAEGARQGAGDGMRRHPDADRGASPEQSRRQIDRGAQDERQRAGPESLSEAYRTLGTIAGHAGDRAGVAGDQRQRHFLGTPLGREDAVDGGGVTRIAGQPVERLGRVGDQQTASQERRRLLDDLGLGMERVDRQEPDRHVRLRGLGRVRLTITQRDRRAADPGARAVRFDAGAVR
jgi:peptide/nickel transport system substrate-binding protein